MSRSYEFCVVVPVYNEEASIPKFLEEIIPHLEKVSTDWSVLFVNDGSRDNTLEVLRAAHKNNPRVTVIDFSRNYGKEAALSAGLDFAEARAVIPMDVDLQDPPELIADMVAKWRDGNDVVLAQRVDRSADSFMKRASAAAFYNLIGRLSRVHIPENVGDFRLMDRKVIEALREYPERERFMKGIFASLGFRTVSIPYARPPRALGETKFKPVGLFNLALEGVISFTTAPLKIWTYIGFMISFAAIFYTGYTVLRTLIFGIDVPGYASLLSVMLLSNGVVLIGLGIQGEYIARIFSEVKARPRYIVRERIGLDENKT